MPYFRSISQNRYNTGFPLPLSILLRFSSDTNPLGNCPQVQHPCFGLSVDQEEGIGPCVILSRIVSLTPRRSSDQTSGQRFWSWRSRGAELDSELDDSFPFPLYHQRPSFSSLPHSLGTFPAADTAAADMANETLDHGWDDDAAADGYVLEVLRGEVREERGGRRERRLCREAMRLALCVCLHAGVVQCDGWMDTAVGVGRYLSRMCAELFPLSFSYLFPLLF